MAMCLTACSNEDYTTEFTLFDIAKMEKSSNQGSTFTVQKPDANDGATLYAAQHISGDAVKVGDRVLIVYTPLDGNDAYTTGKIRLIGYRPIVNDLLREETLADIGYWDRTPIHLLSAWRSGNYLNIRARLPYYEQPRHMALVLNTESPDPTRPDLYLCHAIEEDINTFNREYYLSFDITKLVENPDITAFTLHLNNSNLNLDAITFQIN